MSTPNDELTNGAGQQSGTEVVQKYDQKHGTYNPRSVPGPASGTTNSSPAAPDPNPFKVGQ